MKKLKLNIQQLDNVEVLTRSQLKNVLGGVVTVTTYSIPCNCDNGKSGNVTCSTTLECVTACWNFCG